MAAGMLFSYCVDYAADAFAACVSFSFYPFGVSDSFLFSKPSDSFANAVAASSYSNCILSWNSEESAKKLS